MKKIFALAAAAMMALAVNAQVWVGGNFNFDSSKDKMEASGVSVDNTASNFEIAPEIGYNLNDKVAVAVALGFTHYANAEMELLGQKVAGMANKFSINPYVRYTCCKSGNFSVFVDGGISYSTLHFNGMGAAMDNVNALGVAVRPGISYNISDKVALVAHIGKIGYDYQSTTVKTDPNIDLSNSKFGVNLTNAISFGAYVNL